MTSRNQTRQLVWCALMAALTAVLSQVAVPLPPVPINLALLAVYLAGGVLGPRWGMASQAVYIGLGAVGLPVFSLFRGGLGMLVGPTGGYIAGYILAAGLVGLLVERLGLGLGRLAAAMAAGLALCYALGTAWFMLLTHNTLAAALSACVLPFLPGDALKIFLAALLIPRLRRMIKD